MVLKATVAFCKKPLSFQGGRATLPRGGYGLFVIDVCHVSRGKDTANGSNGRFPPES
jgi:hypothetical protein